MPRVRFIGRVFPSEVRLTVADHPQITWHDDQNNIDTIFTITIQNNTITVDCETNRFDPSLVTFLYMRAFDLARATVDLAAFSSGYGFIVIIETITTPDGQTTTIAAYDPSLAALCKAYQIGVVPATTTDNDFQKVLLLVSTDWRIFRTLRHLIEAITFPHEAGRNCANAIEALRHIIAPNQPSGQAWRNFRNALNISEDYLKMITDVSTGPRHGDPTHIPGPTITEITRRSWRVMNRFFEYKNRNSGPLPLTDFPLLTA